MKNLLVTWAYLVVCGTALATTLYVSPSGSHAYPFADWATAATNIQDAVDAAVDGDTVLLADGIYNITSKINVSKSLMIASVNGAEHVIVDANGNCRVFTLSADSGVIILDGLTLTGGYANHAVTLGGAIFAFGNSDIRIANCIVEDNGSPGSAGGIDIQANTGKYITATVTNCLIRKNEAAKRGGGIGIYIGGSCDISITDCTIEGNRAKNGGGIFCSAPTGSVNISRCVIVANEAVEYAGGIGCQGNILLFDSLIVGNRAGQRGGGAHGGADDSDSYIVNCTIVDNEAPFGGGASRATLINSIVHGNRAGTYPDITPNSIAAFSCAPGLTPGINGNINADPQFVDLEHGDFRLLITSPCLDTGTNAFVSSLYDLDGLTRIVDADFDGIPTVDMGAYEFPTIMIPSGCLRIPPINIKSKGRTPVAVTSTDDFDATTIDPPTVRFAGAEPVHYALEDVNGDGDIDLKLHFKTADLDIDPADGEVMLIGQTCDGVLVVGMDKVKVGPHWRAR